MKGISRRRSAAAAALGLLFLSVVSLTSSAGAQTSTPGCGSVITSNTVLQADVGPCNNSHGLIVRGSNFTLDLNGHRVFSNAPLPRNVGVDANGFYIPADFVGILLDGATNVTVQNGTVERFSAGVSIENGGSNTVQGLTSQFNQGPCIGEDFSTFAVGSYGDGIVVFGSPNNRILGNAIRNNGPFSGVALVANTVFITQAVAPYPSGNVVSRNNIEDNNTCFADIGVRIEGPGASNTQVTSNVIRGSFQEGITVNPVNVINFQPLFQTPPQCQNRGFPNPNLPQCPIQNPLNPTNDNNLIANNTVTFNGYGGQQQGAGPTRVPPPNPQTADGINLLAFCGYGARSNATGNTIQNNIVTYNAGNGINVGGCPPGQNPAQGTFPGYTNSRILSNISVFNNGANCGTLPPTPGCGSRPTTARFDLHDGSNEVTCPSTTASTQNNVCAPLGFGPPPAQPTPFIGTRVIVPGNPPCDNNFWFGNVYGTAFPPCTTNGGRQFSIFSGTGGGGTSAEAPSVGARGEDGVSGASADAGGGAAPEPDNLFPLRRPRSG